LEVLLVKSRKHLGRKVPCRKCNTPFVLEEMQAEQDDIETADEFGDGEFGDGEFGDGEFGDGEFGDGEYQALPKRRRRRRKTADRVHSQRRTPQSAARPNWVLPVAIGGGVLGFVALVGILIWALGGGDDTGTPEQPVSTPTASKPVDDPTPAAKTPDAASPIENSIGMVLVPIPAGEFMMGSRFSAAEVAKRFGPAVAAYVKDEYPRHRVTLTKSFHLGRTEVTQGQWTEVMGTTPWKDKYGVREGDDYPAVNVNWEDAVEFCRKLSEKEGVEYRLPTEAEWEYACRAGTTTMYSFGDDESQLGEYAWYSKNTIFFGKEEYAHIVGQKKPNKWGLYDMHGNVFEWCQDWKAEYPSGDVTDPAGPASGSNRAFRGGCWSDDAGICRSANRFLSTPSSRDFFLGFRVLRSSAK